MAKDSEKDIKYNQNYLLSQMQKYLKLQMEQNPDEYKPQDVEYIIQTLYRGHCLGFASLWAQCMLEDNEQIFLDIMKEVSLWDGKEINDKIKNNFEIAISAARFTHVAGLKKEQLDWKRDLNKMPNADTLEHSIDNLHKLTQYDLEKTLENSGIIEHKNISANFVSEEEYQKYIAELCRHTKGKAISFTANGHNIAFYNKGDEVVIYNSNYDNKSDAINGATKTIQTSNNEDYVTLASELKSCFKYEERMLKKTKADVSRITFSVLGDKNNEKNIQLEKLFKTTLFGAIKSGDIQKIKEFTEKPGFEIDKIFNGSTPLMYAAENGNIKSAEALIEAGADLNASNESKITPLMRAAYYKNSSIARMLIESGANISATSILDQTALISAAMANDIKTFNLLAEKTFDINEVDKNGKTALIHAAQNYNTEIANALIEMGANLKLKDSQEKNALIHAAQNGNIKIVNALIEKGAYTDSSDKQFKTALFYAAENGHFEICESIIKSNSYIRKNLSNKDELLLYAIEKSNADMIQKLINIDAKLQAEYPKEVTDYFFELVKQKNYSDIKGLIKAGIDVNLKNKEGKSAIIIASEDKDMELIVELIRAEANLENMPGKDDALLYAMQSSNMDMLKNLKNAGAEAPVPTLAQAQKNLILEKADIAQQAGKGNILEVAAKNLDPNMHLKSLVKEGANVAQGGKKNNDILTLSNSNLLQLIEELEHKKFNEFIKKDSVQKALKKGYFKAEDLQGKTMELLEILTSKNALGCYRNDKKCGSEQPLFDNIKDLPAKKLKLLFSDAAISGYRKSNKKFPKMIDDLKGLDTDVIEKINMEQLGKAYKEGESLQDYAKKHNIDITPKQQENSLKQNPIVGKHTQIQGQQNAQKNKGPAR